MISRRDLASALGKRGLADWVVVERAQDLAVIDEQTKTRRVERRVLWQITVHVDTPAGRGSAHVTIDAVDGNVGAAVDQAVALAQSSMGPAWISRPLAAPARVKLEDPAIAKQEPLATATDVIKKLARPADVTARVSVVREQVNVIARQGFRTTWNATLIECEALVSAGNHSVIVARQARQRASLELDAALADAKRDLAALDTAGAPTAGPCALVLTADAMLHEGLGLWAAFVTQGDAVVERQGLTRYREKAPIAPGAEKVYDPLSVTSDGAADYGLMSAPIGEYGDAVRTFKLIENGVAVGFGLTPREGALRGRDPNGGVRNLDVARGKHWDGNVEKAYLSVKNQRVVEVRRLRSLSIDPYTGDASLEIALGVELTFGSAKSFTGGSLRLDLIGALAKARRSTKSITRGAYTGPDAVWIDNAELVT